MARTGVKHHAEGQDESAIGSRITRHTKVDTPLQSNSGQKSLAPYRECRGPRSSHNEKELRPRHFR